MAAIAPDIQKPTIEHPRSEQEVVTGRRRGRPRKPRMLNDEELKQMLREYWAEAENARKSGTDGREDNWRENYNAYWGRTVDKDKAEWQASEQMPEVANFVDRHAAALRLALLSQPDWFDINDPTDPTKHRDRMMRELVKVNLNHCTTNKSGQPIGFDSTFGAAVKAGSMTVLAASVTFDPRTRFVRVDPVNGLELYYDPTGRGLYRIRRRQADRWQLEKMKRERDSAGKPLYDAKAIERLQHHIDEEAKNRREEQTGGSEEGTGPSRRKPVELDEYLCTIIDRDGRLIRENQLIVFANQREIIRGPEDNPNWHGKDWIVMTPAIDVPFSVWGRTYVEVFRGIAATFTEVTNLILDGTFASSIAAHQVWLDALANPSEIAEGVHPGIVVTADPDWPAGKDFVRRIEMGGVTADVLRIWEALKAELREGAQANELSLGQVPPKGDITATEIRGSERGESTLTFALAKDIETKFLQPILELVLMTSLQHFDTEANPLLAEELGPEMAEMLSNNRRNFAKKKYKFVARGISAAMERGKKLQGLLAFLQVLGQSEVLAAAFAENHSIMSLIRELLAAFDIDSRTLEKTIEEKRRDAQQQAEARAAASAGAGAGATGGATGPGARGGAPVPRGLPQL